MSFSIDTINLKCSCSFLLISAISSSLISQNSISAPSITPGIPNTICFMLLQSEINPSITEITFSQSIVSQTVHSFLMIFPVADTIFLSGPNILTVYPDSKLYQEIQNGNRQEDEELEKILNIPTYFAAKGAKIHSGS